MKKTLYIIPGFEETCRRRPYQVLAKIAREKGYEVIFINVAWKQKLSTQIFPVSKDSIIFGFSLGAVLARLVAQEYPCKLIILGSITPLDCFSTNVEMKKALVDLLGSKFVNDVTKKLLPKRKAIKQITIYGDKEGEKADVLVKNTDHEITSEYIKAIVELI